MCQNIFPPKMDTIHPFKDDETVTKALTYTSLQGQSNKFYSSKL